MSKVEVVKSSQEQAVAAWINYRFVLRIQELAKQLAEQDINLNAAMAELRKFKIFISDPKHILGSPLQKHGEIAEHAQVRFANAADLIEGKAARHTFDGVARLAKEDYLRNGKMVQSKFYQGPAGTLRAIATHLDTYPSFLSEGGQYDIPKSQFDYLINVYRGGEHGTLLDSSDAKMYDAIKDWETSNNIKFPDVVKPSNFDYDQIQLDAAPSTLKAEQEKIEARDQELRDQARQAHKPTVQEGIKVTAVAAVLEVGMAFGVTVYQKRKGGKKLSEFSNSDWEEIAKQSGIGGFKGAVRGGSVYLLTNFTDTASPMANAMITATFGMLAEANKLRMGKITAEDFIVSSETICMDVTVSAISSVIGQVAIPIPVLGAVIGNTAGMFMENIAKSYLSAEEEKLIVEYKKSMEAHDKQLSEDHQAFLESTMAKLRAYEDLASLAFDTDANVRLESAKARATLLGASDKRILSDDDMDAMFDSSEPYNL